MRRFKYTGDPCLVKQTQNPTAGVFGYEFELDGDAVEVDDKFANKLAGNSHFTEVTGKKKAAKKK